MFYDEDFDNARVIRNSKGGVFTVSFMSMNMYEPTLLCIRYARTNTYRAYFVHHDTQNRTPVRKDWPFYKWAIKKLTDEE
jgi:hypothetical protein